MALRLASKALCSAGTKTTKESLIERLATPSTKHSATSNQGTKRLICFTLASSAGRRQVSRRGGVGLDNTIIIEPRFNGPRLSGNGGYVGGVMAGKFTERFGGDGTVEITLRAPIPIDRALQVAREGDV